jgi:hypothetical protein
MTGTTATDINDGPSPGVELDLLATLVLDLDARQDWLRHQESPQMVRLFSDAFMRLGGLVNDTGWEPDVLLSELGCKTRSRSDLERLCEAQLQACCSFFEWVTALLSLAPDQNARQDTIGLATRLYADSRQRIYDCKAALEGRGPNDKLTPLELVALGEIGTALQLARRLVRHRHQPDQGARFAAKPQPHIRTPTLDVLLRYPPGVPGAAISFERAGRLVTHIEECDQCNAASKARAALYGLEASEPIRFQPIMAV